MNSHSETTTVNGATVEVGTIEHDGRSFDAYGSMIDLANGVIVGYVAEQAPGSYLHCLQTWNGAKLFDLRVTGKARGFYPSKLTCYSAVYDGHHWHGRGLGTGMVLTLRRGKPCAK